MAEPPAKRARRTDSSAMWEQNEHSSKPDTSRHTSSRRDVPKGDSRDRRYRSRSRERKERRRERSADDKMNSTDAPSGKERRDGRDRDRRPRERSGSRDRQKPRREDRDRQRSRSPYREGSRRSPPRGPRTFRNRSRERHHAPPNGVDRRKSSQPSTSSRAQERSEKPVPNGEAKSAMDIDDAPGEAAEDDLEAQMQAVMGFGNFKSTKNKKVPGNDKLYGVRKEKKTEYRQYMNRVGGFNRPLSPSHE